MPSRIVVKIACLALGLVAAANACGQQLEPRTYANTPVGMSFLVVGYAYSSGGLSTNPALKLTNAELKVHTPVVAYARSLDAWGKSAKVDAVLAEGCLSGSAQVDGVPATRDVCGPLDPAVRFSVNLYGAPALRMKDFTSYRQDVIVGASLQVSAPLGQYDPTRLVNLGTNRWAFRPEIGISKAWDPLTVEVALGASFFTTNNDFFGGKTREQDPVYSTQLHLIYQLRGGAWAALNGTFYTGGRSTVNGVKNDDELRNSRAGITLALPVDRHHSIKLHASKGLSVRTGTDFTTFGAFWQYRWGGGL
jgi:hypothetical protein